MFDVVHINIVVAIKNSSSVIVIHVSAMYKPIFSSTGPKLDSRYDYGILSLVYVCISASAICLTSFLNGISSENVRPD